VNLEGVVSHPVGPLRVDPFGQGRFTRTPLALILEPAGLEPEEPTNVIVALHAGDHLLHQLQPADLLALHRA
jgi:hypothetical protein